MLSGLWMGSFWLYLGTDIGPWLANALFSRTFSVENVPDWNFYFGLMPIVTILTMLVYRNLKLYIPRRSDQRWREMFEIAKANILAIVVLIALSFFYREKSISRGVVCIYAFLSTIGMAINRASARSILRKLRRRGLNQRHIIIVGCGELGKAFYDRVSRNPWTGLRVTGFVDDNDQKLSDEIRGIPVLGAIGELENILKAHTKLDQIYITLPYDRIDKLKSVFDQIGEIPIDVRLIPDIMSFETLRTDVSDFDGLPIISLRGTPLFGWSVFAKRMADIVFSFVVLVLLSPLFLVLATIIKLTSKGPVFYGQVRMGLDGQIFKMWKFRSMRADAEAQSGAVMAKKDESGKDPRATKIGNFMRKYNIDEFPQFFNVLIGQMSVVGPRPERPELIENFKGTIPRYMLRHRVKSGITGWAQVNGLRGSETSLEKRIEFDLFYIENWSPGLDIFIFFKTLFTFGKGF